MKRTSIIIVALIIAAVLGIQAYRHFSKEKEPPYRFMTVERGDIEAKVSATGKLSAVTTVVVGTQVSGKIVEILADFNDRVKKGQLVARVDPTLTEQNVRDAQAGLERARAQLEQDQREYDRSKQLFDRKVLTEIEFNTAKYALAISQANVKSAQVVLDRARQNLAYTTIFAPIDGVVVERNVDVGQTVAASLSAPQLFLIANDLAQMQILASVDESDIGAIKQDQPVRFSVQAYPNESFTGTVKQVRLQSTTTENVVNYTVVVSVSNPTGRLLPGMTATLEFVTGSASNVLMVQNAALRFRPTEEMMAQVRDKLQKSGRRPGEAVAGEDGAPGGELTSNTEAGGAANGERRGNAGAAAGSRASTASEAGTNFGGERNARANGGGGGAAAGGRESGVGPGGNGVGGGAGPGAGAGAASGPRFGNRRANSVMLWHLDEAGELAVARARIGLTDGQRTEIQGRDIKEGMQVIIGVTQSSEPKTGTNPFQPQAPGGGQARRPGGF